MGQRFTFNMKVYAAVVASCGLFWYAVGYYIHSLF